MSENPHLADTARKFESARAWWWLVLWTVFLVASSLVLLVLVAVLFVRRTDCPVVTVCPVVTTDVPVHIKDPIEGRTVPTREITVTGTLPNCLPSGTNLYILVRSNLGMYDKYWLQDPPVVSCDGWRGKAGIGGINDPSGMSYRVCAVMTDETLTKDKSVSDLPPGPSHCIEVKR